MQQLKEKFGVRVWSHNTIFCPVFPFDMIRKKSCVNTGQIETIVPNYVIVLLL